MLDSFFNLKMGRGLEGEVNSFGSKLATRTSSFTLKDGKFSLTIDSKNFDPEDIDIRVEGEKLVVHGEREVHEADGLPQPRMTWVSKSPAVGGWPRTSPVLDLELVPWVYSHHLTLLLVVSGPTSGLARAFGPWAHLWAGL